MPGRSCPACGTSDSGGHIAHVALKTPDGHPLQGGYSVVSCAVCGCGFADVVVPELYYQRYYEQLAKYADEASMLRSSRTHATMTEAEWLAEKGDAEAERIASLLPSTQARILDVGCGGGTLLGALRRRGFQNICGVDPSPQAVAQARDALGVKALVGTLESLPSDVGRFDCVCLTGVLEHVWEVGSAVEALDTVLEAGGIIYLEVPDARRYLDPYLAPFEDFNTEHVNHFSLATLNELGRRFNYTPVYEESYETWLTEDAKTAVAAVAWTRSDATSVARSGRDELLDRVLRAYTDRSERELEEIDAALGKTLGAADDYILWGIGELAFKLLALPSMASRNAIALVDGSGSRRRFSFDGLGVSNPTELVSSSAPIVISSFLRANPIASAVREQGLQNPIVRLDALRSAREPS